MNLIVGIFLIFWFLRQIKSILFWLYLWQLKEYHVGRFIDHFRTEKGKNLLFNKRIGIKIIVATILAAYIIYAHFAYLYFFIEISLVVLSITGYFLGWVLYVLEVIKFFLELIKKQLKIPIFTSKVIVLTLAAITITLLFISLLYKIADFVYLHFTKGNFLGFIFSFLIGALLFDIFTPLIVSIIVLSFQPIAALLRNQIIKKAKKKRETFKDLLVIGICGSYGKTSTKEFLATILEEKFGEKVLKTKEHQNSDVGISRCILENLNENHKIFVVEMGAYNKGGIKLLCDIVKPKIGIITGVNEQHLALFGSMKNLISAEGGKELIESLPENGLVIFNGENEMLRKIYQETKIKKKIVGVSKKDFDLWAGNIKVKKDVLFFQVFSKDGEMADLNLNLIGEQNIQNLLLAICCAKELGMNLKEISKGAKEIKQEQSGVKLLKTKDGLNIIDSTYSANPDSVFAHLNYLKVWQGKKVIVMPCLIELGKASKNIHKKIGEKIFEICDLAIITTKDRFREIREGAKEKAIYLEKPKEIYERIKPFNGENDIILFEGRLPKEFLNLVYEN